MGQGLLEADFDFSFWTLGGAVLRILNRLWKVTVRIF